MPGGRPSDYKPEYCEQIVEYMSQGKHVIQFAAKVGTSKATVYRWADEHPEFRDALNDAQAASAAWWIDLHQDTASGKGRGDIEQSGNRRLGNPTLIIQMLKNKDKEFCETQSAELKVDVDNNLSGVSVELLTALAKELSGNKS